MTDNFRVVDTSQNKNVDINIDYARSNLAVLIYN